MSEFKTTEQTELAPSERWVDLYGDYLFKHALVRLRDPVKAEDAVQETFLAALKAGHSFAGRAAAKSWLLGILKNKIYDYFRRSGRETSFTDLGFYAAEENASFQAGGLSDGKWVGQLGPIEWPDPGANLDNQAFWTAFHACAKKMPTKISAAFTLREIDGLESKEICSMLCISEKNLWVMLHRARMALRRCLETTWLKRTDP